MTNSYPTASAVAAQSQKLASTSFIPSVANDDDNGAPFLKWVGSKRRLMSQLLPLLPTGKRLIEPFVGGGSVFMASNYEKYLLADCNRTLMSLYSLLKFKPSAMVNQAKDLFIEANRSQEAYNALRDRYNDSDTTEVEKAALFVYFNKFAFNGLHRLNKLGRFNVPYAKHAKLPGFPQDAIERFASKLAKAHLLCADFVQTMAQAVPGDVVYCDPVYVNREDSQGSTTKSFNGYNAQGFGMEQQERLAHMARALASKGVPVVISNHDTPTTRALYAGATLHTVQAYRSMAANVNARGNVAELVAVFGG